MEKRVLIYTNHFFPENFRINELATTLSKNNYNIHVITCIPNYPSGKFFEGYGFNDKRNEYINKNLRVTRLPIIPRGSGSKFKLILNYLSYFFSTLLYTFYLIFFQKKYEYVFVHHTSPVFITFHPILYKFFRKSKIFLWDLDMWPDTLVALNILKNVYLISILNFIMKFVYKSYDKILIGSQSFVEIARKRVDKKNIEFFPNWAEQVFFDKIREPNKPIIFPEGYNILYTGNIGFAQDFDTIINSALKLHKHNVNFIFIGDGRFKEELKSKILRLKIKNIFLFNQQPIDYIPYYLSKSNALIFSLKNEDVFNKTVPAKLQTYMTAKKPIIGIIGGEGKQIIKESNCGINVLTGETDKLIENILILKNSTKEQLDKLAENAFSYYKINYDFKIRLTQLKKLLN